MGPLGAVLRPSWGSLVALLAPSWGSLGPSGHSLGPYLGGLRPSWGLLGGLLDRIGVILGASEVVKNGTKTKTTNMLKMYDLRSEWDDFGLSGPSWEASGEPLGVSSRPLGSSWEPSWASWSGLWARRVALGACSGSLGAFWWRFVGLRRIFGARLGRLGCLLECPKTLWGCLGALLGASWDVFGRSWGPLTSSRTVGRQQKQIF